MEIIEIEIDRVKPYENNPNAHPQAQIERIAKSIQEFGFKVPIILDKDFVIIAGHGRYAAAKKLGLKKVPVVIATDLTPEQVKAFRIADNRLAAESNWDFDKLAVELKALAEEGYDVDLTFLDEREIEYFLNTVGTGQSLLDEDDFNPYSEWEGMPEYNPPLGKEFARIVIHFETEADFNRFVEITGLPLNPTSRATWFPPKEKEDKTSVGWKVIDDGIEGEEE